MKKFGLSLLTVSVLSVTTLSAQETSKSPSYISVGPVAGVGHTWVSTVGHQNIKPAAQLGAAIMYSRYEHWGFGALITASHEGYSADVYRYNNWYTNTFDPTYLRVTPRAYYFFGNYGDVVRPKVFLGPSVAYKLAEDQYLNEPGPFESTNITIQGTPIFNDWDFGINTGAGVNIQLYNRTWLNMDGDYYHGLTNATMGLDKNRSVRANVGLLFGL